MTRILAFSDMHLSRACAAAVVEASAEADLVIGAGDFCVKRQGLDQAMALLEGLQAPLICVPGNAETARELGAASRATLRATILHGGATAFAGLTIYGLGYAVPTTPFGDWSCDLTEAQAESMLAGLDGADIMVSHSPPHGVADLNAEGESIGSTAVRAAIERAQPRLCLCGHVHDSWGRTGTIGRTEVHNLGPKPNWFEV